MRLMRVQLLTKPRSLLFYAIVAVAVWTVIVVRFAIRDDAGAWLSAAAPRPRGVQLLLTERRLPQHKIPSETDTEVKETVGRPSDEDEGPSDDELNLVPTDDIEDASEESTALRKVPPKIEIIDGFENPNGLPKLPRLGPPSFFEVLAPPYYGKSPVDGSRNYEPFSERRIAAGCDEGSFFDSLVNRPRRPEGLSDDVASHLTKWSAVPVPKDAALCSYGPEDFTPSSFHVVQSEGDEVDTRVEYAAYVFHEVCLTMNIDSSKRVQRGLIYFDPLNSHPMRCAACPNPIEMQRWGDHACGLMWNHQINAKSLLDYSKCYRDNLKFAAKAGQRQSPGERVEGGIFYTQTVAVLSFAHKNPGHQMFDSLFTMLPWIVDGRGLRGRFGVDKFIILQNPSCVGSEEWICAMLRKMQVIADAENDLIPVMDGFVPCFKSLVVPKWGLFRNRAVPQELLTRFRGHLFSAFELKEKDTDAEPRKPKMLLYAHDTKSAEVNQHRRIWVDMKRQFLSSADVQARYDVHIVDDFAALSLDDQARAFFEADVILMPHGGQFGNALFAREGTIMIELVCSGYSHLGLINGGKELLGYVPKALGFIHIVLVPCACDIKRDVDSNFRFAPDSALNLIDTVRATLKAGTHVKRESCPVAN